MHRAVSVKFLRIVAIVAGLSGGGIAAGPAASDNLADALIGAYNTSGLLTQNRALLRAADEDVAQAVGALLPIVEFTASLERDLIDSRVGNVLNITRNTDFFTGISLQQLIYDGGSALLTRDAAKENVLSVRQSLVQIEQQVLFRAVAAYLGVLLQEENVIIRENNVRVLGEELRASQDRFEVGEVTRTDVALSESRLAAARANLANARGALTSAKAEYVNAVGQDPGRTGGQPPLPQSAASLDAAVALAVRNHPAILSAQHSVKAAELVLAASQRRLGPNVVLQADIGYNDRYDSNNFTKSATAGLVYRQSIYAGGQLASQIRRSMAIRDSQRANLLNTQRDVIQAVRDSFVGLETARASLTASNERVRAAQVAFDGIREEATLGARTTLDVLTAEQELLDAQLEQITARAERSLAAYQLLSAQGLLTAEQLGLAVEIYDPTLYYNLVKSAPAQVSKRSRDLDRVLKALGKQ